MRPPILFLTVAFGVGLWAGLDPFVFPGRALPGGALWVVALPVLAVAAWLARRAPLGAAVGIMGVAGMLWGTAAVREREVTCSGRWTAGVRAREKAGEGRTRAVIVRLADPAPAQGGIVDADVLPGACAGSVRLRWPEGTGARGGTTWVVAGKWTGSVLVVRRTRADRERARVRPQRGTRFRYPRALRAIGSRAPPLHLRAARWVHGRLARPHSRQTAPRGARPLRRDGRPAARLPLVARLPGARRPGRRDAGIGGRRAPARACRRAARRGGARGARRAGAGPMGPAVGGRVAVDCGRGRGGLGRPRLRSRASPRQRSSPRSSPRRSARSPSVPWRRSVCWPISSRSRSPASPCRVS